MKRAVLIVERRQLIALAIAWLLLGAALAIVLRAWVREHLAPVPVTALDPVVELVNERMTVTRLRFDADGRTTSCHLTAYLDRSTWRLEC